MSATKTEWRDVTVDGVVVKVKAWTTAVRRGQLKKLRDIMALPVDDREDAAITFAADNTQTKKEEIEGWDAVIFDKVLSAIVTSNQAPKVQSAQ